MSVNINALLGSEQMLVCFANVPNLQYPMRETGLKLRVDIEKPNIVCNNITLEDAKMDKYIELVSNITKPSKNVKLTCENVF